jgi:hypothetical protein
MTLKDGSTTRSAFAPFVTAFASEPGDVIEDEEMETVPEASMLIAGAFCAVDGFATTKLKV